MRDLGDFLAEGGAIVGGSAALFGTLGFVAGSLVHDFRQETDPEEWARKGAAVGGVVGLSAPLTRHRLLAVRSRTRFYVWLAVGLVAGIVYGRLSRDWSFGNFYAGFVGVGLVVWLIGMLWTELAPDGDLRRTPQS